VGGSGVPFLPVGRMGQPTRREVRSLVPGYYERMFGIHHLGVEKV
jgi:hypothetical protein